MKVFVPPIKSQGIKTKLVEWISSNVEKIQFDRWVEPFMGTGVVAFNIRAKKALLCDSNPHIINFYNSLKNKEITTGIVREYLALEGEKLLKSEGRYYYELRNRFNEEGSLLDFLFLSRFLLQWHDENLIKKVALMFLFVKSLIAFLKLL